MKFRELGGILCMCIVYKACVYSVWGRILGDESRGVSEVASHREENAENDLSME